MQSGNEESRFMDGQLELRHATDERTPSVDQGFTLIELLIVMSVMLILMTLAIPQMLKLTKQAHETSAMQSLRAINQAELQYSSSYPLSGFACSLPVLGGKPGSGAPSAESAQLIPDDLASGNKAGYSFNITNCAKVSVNGKDQNTSYEVIAVPNSIGHSGDRGFCSDANNQLRYDPKGGTNCTELLQ